MTHRHLVRVVVCLAVLLGFGVSGSSQDIGDPDRDPEAWGTGTGMDFVSAEEFQCGDTSSICAYSHCQTNYWCASSGDAVILAPVNLPPGSLITGLRIFYRDVSSGTNIDLSLNVGWCSGGTRGSSHLADFTSSGSPGITDTFIDVSPDVTVALRWWNGSAYVYQSYYLSAYLGDGWNTQLRGVALYWNRQISPAPGSATFLDVPTNHWAFQHVEALAASGITAGCGSGNYCPDAPLTRAQMAVFLAKALGLHWPN